MDIETSNQIRPVRKVAAVIGLITVLVLIAWLSITIVKNVPGSFASLASLAESVRSFDASRLNAVDSENLSQQDATKNMLVVTSDINVIETDGNVRLSWTDASAQGSFVFSYQCVDGVNITIVETDGVRNINCATNYNLGNINNMTIHITSDKSRFVDVPYTLGFITTNETQPSATTNATITVVNDSIPLLFADTNDSVTGTKPVTETLSIPVVAETVTSDTTVAETETRSTVVEETFTQEFTYTIPVSDPNGRIDLATRFLNVGRITGNSFVVDELEKNETGALQFEVKNLGTKTSDEWTYVITLPSGGIIESTNQKALKPNERAVITIGFPAVDIDQFDFVVRIDTESDNTSLNDRFIKAVTFN